MREHEGSHHFERFDHLARVQAELAQRGFFLHPVPREHTEALVTGPLIHRLHSQIKKRGFSRVAGHVAITFSGYSSDVREVYEISEIRAYWRALDAQLPELPALLATIPELRYNGPGIQVMMLGEVDAVEEGDMPGSYLTHVVQGPALIEDGIRRIRAAGMKYHLHGVVVQNSVELFLQGAGSG